MPIGTQGLLIRVASMMVHCPAGWAFSVHHRCVVVFSRFFDISSSGAVQRVSDGTRHSSRADHVSGNTVSGDITADALLPSIVVFRSNPSIMPGRTIVIHIPVLHLSC